MILRYYSLTSISLFYRYTIKHSGVTLNNIAVLKDFIRDVVFRIKSKYNDSKICLSFII